MSEHFIVLRHRGKRVSGVSIRKAKNVAGHSEDSKVWLKLTVTHELLLAGEWKERTSKHRLYSGQLALTSDATRSKLNGRWLGFDSDYAIKTNSWTLTRETLSVRWQDRRKYAGLSSTLR